MLACFCHHLSGNYVDLSDLYVDLLNLLLVIYSFGDFVLIKNVFFAQLMHTAKKNYLASRQTTYKVNIKIRHVDSIYSTDISTSSYNNFT